MLLLLLRRSAPLSVVSRGLARRRDTRLMSAGSQALSEFFALPSGAVEGLEGLGVTVAAPVQEAVWASESGPGAAKGESLCVHAPTGSGKTIAMALPAVSSVLWSGRSKGKVLVLAPSRELVAQHAEVLGAMVGDEHVATVTTSTLGTDGAAEEVADAVEASSAVVATPGELCRVLEARPTLYGALNVEALVLDELDLLMPARKFGGGKVSRWQDKGFHPAEAVATLVAKRSVETLQVLAGSATLDKASKKKLEKCLRGSPIVGGKLPLRTVTLEGADAGGQISLTVKTKKDMRSPANERTTLTSSKLRHASKTISNKAASREYFDALSSCASTLEPRCALVFVCSSSALKVRAVAAHLADACPGTTEVLNDALFPSSQRNRRRNYASRDAKDKKRAAAAESDMDAAKRATLTKAAADALAERVRAATTRAPLFLVADQAVTRGLHVDDVDTVIILGRPSNADTYLHLAGRADRDPLNRHTQAGQATVLTLAKTKDVNALASWLADLNQGLDELES